MKNIYCICYNTLYIFTSKENAKYFYTTCFYASEGCERERYANILIDLDTCSIGKDNSEALINKIIYFDKFKKRRKEEKIEWEDYTKVIEEIEKGVN